MHPVDDTIYPTRQLRRAAARAALKGRLFRTNHWVKPDHGGAARPLDQVEPRVHPLTLPRVQRREMLRFFAGLGRPRGARRAA